MCSCHLFLISSASVRFISVLYRTHLCMKCSLGISNLLEEISSLSHSVFFYFFALIAEEDFLISPCYSLELCIRIRISFLFSFAFHFSSFLSCLSGLLRHPVPSVNISNFMDFQHPMGDFMDVIEQDRKRPLCNYAQTGIKVNTMQLPKWPADPLHC